ncbi:MAG: hypothetical protein IPK50_04530 [Fibrobacterota bacterium]|nr:hypothetical protein [Fibrobacterota bacterium]QQS06162.1 MAG: hypothetical protein IPK50_04530 [Fibrobacterota bacterium]
MNFVSRIKTMFRKQNLSSSTIQRLTGHGGLLGRLGLATILLAASFAAAIPLHIGESWVWQVSDRSSTFVTYRSARVVDSHSVDQGKVWTLVARDSTDGSQDTAKVLVTRNGRQMWLKASPLLLWELEPYKVPDTSLVVVDGDTARVWGETSVGDLKYRPTGILGRSPKLNVSTSGISFESMALLSFLQSLPLHRWSDSVGMEQALTFDKNRHGWDWRIVSHNGRSRAVERDSLFLPAVGTRLAWAHSQNGIRSSLEWTLREILPDSLEWTRLRAASQQVKCKQTLLITSANPTGASVDSPCVDTIKLPIEIRINASTGQSFRSDSLAPRPELGWIRRWEDSLWRDTSTSSTFHFREVTNSGIPITTGFHREFQRSQGQISHWLSYTINASSPIAFTTARPTYDSSWTTLVLLKIIPPGGDSSGTGTRVRPLQPAPQTLAMIAAQHPSLAIRWSTASGRTGTLTASDFVHSPAALRGKTLFLLARLPDGRLWQGTHVMP